MDEKKEKDLETAFSRYYQMLYKISVIMLCNEQDANDAVQETFVRYLEYKNGFHDEDHEKAWLIRVNIKNLSLLTIGYQSGKKDAAGNAIKVVQSPSTLKGIYFVVALCGALGNFLPALMYSLDRFTGKRRDAILLELDEMRAKRKAAETADDLETVGENA